MCVVSSWRVRYIRQPTLGSSVSEPTAFCGPQPSCITGEGGGGGTGCCTGFVKHLCITLQICHSKSGEINPVKVANLVKGYVEKYKHIRKYKKGAEGESSKETDSKAEES